MEIVMMGTRTDAQRAAAHDQHRLRLRDARLTPLQPVHALRLRPRVLGSAARVAGCDLRMRRR